MWIKRTILIILFIRSFAILCLNAQEVLPGSKTEESNEQGLATKKVQFYLSRVETIKDDFGKFRDFFASRAKKNASYSNYSFWGKVISQIVGVFTVVYLNKNENENASWIVWGVSGALPLTIEAVEKIGGDWDNKSKIYQSLSIETGELIRRIELELNYIREFAFSDTLRAYNFLEEVISSWNNVRKKVPETLKKEDIENVKNDYLFQKRPSPFELDFQ